ncbi:hypothetical protein BAU06_15180 [Bordetella bronchialis]|uniref:Uncharacterized protein n=1 Tax=Bordetella bronchialis TaxID=463025 RepID=A0ABM6CTR9_9BORD|nr:hypothetical protein BAU06_15180 [Bordetella bronchialis]
MNRTWSSETNLINTRVSSDDASFVKASLFPEGHQKSGFVVAVVFTCTRPQSIVADCVWGLKENSTPGGVVE